MDMSTELSAAPPDPVTADPEAILTALLCRTVSASNSKAAYANALRKFFDWLNGRPIGRGVVFEYREAMEASGLAPATVNLRLTAIRQLCREARAAGMLDRDTAEAVATVRGPRSAGRRTGNWLNAAQSAALILAPPPDTLRGKRDRAILATLLGCGIRRAELARLRDSDVAQREGRWCIVDLAGKGRRIRTVPMPSWAKSFIDLWTAARDAAVAATIVDTAAATLIDAPRLFVSLDNRGRAGNSMSANAIYETVLYWARRAGLPIAPHDLRRTFSRLALAGKADLHQIQLSLGHSSIQTTERYLGAKQDLANAPCDALGIVLDRNIFLKRLGRQDHDKEDCERLIEEHRRAIANP
jgi:integrase